ncbi:DegT/DnrJ/EryC1/StrS family aminotransferase [Solitalea sp. MAHUQ-68]|uniref:DegT/DnrJ/EryC1/StrS family aminotransferase n=1 Tax=Solitalea agri TaxID=2953739 RepID=A0A9X2F3S5_9SPHI|nr:DegT/DnrJ/EryC1/StrS family aminotransferase [Solitalea agri]MCO4293645.1 DegT/DnrJ/EryC1/StrS family aminotransferase [Solitalea agri]
MEKVQMVDLKGQYLKIKQDIDAAIQNCINDGYFINGPEVKLFQENLAQYLNVNHVVTCGNGTDALQIAMMALDLQSGDEIIVPAFTYVATAEVIALLGLTPVMVEVDPDTFNITADLIEKAITPKTRAVVPVHLFGQCCDMEPIMQLAEKYQLYVIEDTAQALGAQYTFSNGIVKSAGTIGHIGCTSFFPSKNLGCYGDGGALMTNDETFAKKLQKIANHGQSKKYYHEVVGVNSRLDTIQAAVLNVKLAKLDEYAKSRNYAAYRYDEAFSKIEGVQIPKRQPNSTHVFHQYTLKLSEVHRNGLKKHLEEQGIPSMIYYPLPLYKQEAFRSEKYHERDFPVSEALCAQVLSLPMHTELDEVQLDFITNSVISYVSSIKQYA